MTVEESPRKVQLEPSVSDELARRVDLIHERTPAESEYRYLSMMRQIPELTEIPGLDVDWRRPTLLRGLPVNEDVQKTKVLALLLGESVATCVAYWDYNGSYISDIRVSALSNELSSSADLLDIHNDLSFASDRVRPRLLVLVAHEAEGDLPPTLLAPVHEIVAELDADVLAVARGESYEIRCGTKLAWDYPQVRPISLVFEVDGQPAMRMNFDAIEPRRGLEPAAREQAARCLEIVRQTAVAVGEKRGHILRRGEALLIPNDHCLHGRPAFDESGCERLLLRAYCVPRRLVSGGASMLSLQP